MHLSISRLRLGGSQGIASASIRAAIEYTRSATDSVKIKLDNARKGLPGDTLTLTALTLDGVDATSDVSEAMTSAEKASDTAPGALTGSNQSVSAGTEALTVGVLYLVSYEVGAQSAFTSIYPGATSPFPSQAANPLPTTPGVHNRLIECDSTDFGALLRTDGPGTISAFSVKRAEWNYTATGASAGEAIAFTITRGEVTTSRSVTVPVSDEFYVHGTGSDTTGTGSIASPYRTPQFALEQGVGAGDTVFMGAGVYDPFNVEASGTSGSPITITATPGQEYEGVIRGELQSHVAQDGSVESTLPEDKRDGIYIDSQDWIIVEKLTIEWVWRTGVFVVGTVSEQHGHHIIRDNVIRDVGRSAVYVGGNNSSSVIPSGETSSLRTVDVLVEDNDITRTNLEIDVQGLGNVECISAAASASSIVAKGNTIYNSRQYGIDFKAGVNGSYTPVSGDVNFAYGPGNFIEENTITNTERHGIYIDAGQRFCEDITIRNNTVTGCRHGIVLARENGAGSNAFLSLDSIDIFNNVIVDSDQIGIYYHNHPGDTDTGTISNIRTRFNTVVNSDREGGFADLNLDDWSANFSTATMTGNDFSGNLVYSDQQLDMAVNLTGGWSLAENFNVVDGTSTGTDPNFVNAAGGNYALSDPSPAENLVDASLVTGDFLTDKAGNQRSIVGDADAGAIALNVAVAPTWLVDPSITDLDVSFTSSDDATTVVWAFSDTTPSYTVAGGWTGADYQTGSDALSIGPNTISIDSGSTPAGATTLFFFLVNGDSLVSLIKSVSVTIEAGLTVTVQESGVSASPVIQTDANTFSSVPLTGGSIADVEILVGTVSGNSNDTYALTISGLTPTLVSSENSVNRARVDRWRVTNVPANTTEDIVITPDGSVLLEYRACAVVSVAGTHTSQISSDTISSGATALDLAVGTDAGGAVFGLAVSESGTCTFTWSGLAEEYEDAVEINTASTAFTDSVTTETRAITVTRSASSSHMAAMAISWSPS